MFSAKQFPVRTSHSFLLGLIVLQVTLTQSVTVNPNQDKFETSTASSQRNWKTSFIRNNKEIKFIPTKEENKSSGDLTAVKDDSPLSKAHLFGQRKQNLENADSEDLKNRRPNFLTSLKSRNNTKLNLNKESNKIDIILLPQDESDEVSTRPSTYRRRYRNRSKQQQRQTAKHLEETNNEENSKNNAEKNEKSDVKKVDNHSQNETSEDAPTNRLFSKNKRRLFGNRYGNRINKETDKVNEKQNEEGKVEKIEKTEKENSYKFDLNEIKKEETKKEESKTILNETNGNQEHKSEQKPEDKSSEESTDNSVNKDKDSEKTDKVLQKYRVPTASTAATPIEILSTHPSSNYFENNSYNKVNTNGLSNMQLLHTLGMRKVRQPNHHKKRHQLESKSRSQYNINSDSQMYIVKLPPQPYYYYNEKSTYNLKPKNNLPIKMVNNGKIDKVYHYNLPLVEKLMTGRKTFSNKVHKIHDPVQPYYGPYSHNEYDVMSKNNNPFANNKKSDSDSLSGNGYHKADATQEHKKVIPVHEDNVSVEDSDKVLDSRHDFNKFTTSTEFNKFTPSKEFGKFNAKDDYRNFDLSGAYNKFDAQEHYKKFNEKTEYEKFNADDALKKLNTADDYKSFDIKYDFEKFKPSTDSKLFDSTDYKYKVTKPWNYHSKGPSYESNIFSIKPSQTFASSPFDGNSINDKTFLGDKNFRNFDRVKSTSISPIYMKPYVHRYYTNNGRPKSIYVLPQYHKT